MSRSLTTQNLDIAKHAIKTGAKIQKDCWLDQWIVYNNAYGWIDQDGDEYKPDFEGHRWKVIENDAPIPTPKAIKQPKKPEAPKQPKIEPKPEPKPAKIEPEPKPIELPAIEPPKVEIKVEPEPLPKPETQPSSNNLYLVIGLHLILWGFLYFYRK